MSLILDALKKSEQERRRERGPDLQSIHQGPARVRDLPARRWRWTLLIALNAAVFGGWWWYQPPGGKAAAVASPPAVVQGAPVPVAIPAKASPQAPLQSPPQAPSPPSPAAAGHSAPGPEFTRISPQRDASARPSIDADAPVQEFADISPDLRSALPAMTFSFHVYSQNPAERTIIINNRRLREGDDISPGVVLQSITPDGVIIATGHHRIHINVLTDW